MGAGDDFFFTGGGFSDWSGGSAGRFSSGSSSFSGCSSSGYLPPDKETEDQIRDRVLCEQKQKGLPKDADMLPVFLTRGQWFGRIVFLLLLLTLPIFGCLLYLNRPEPIACWLGGFFYLTALCWIIYLAKESPNRYPVQKIVTKRVIMRRLIIDELLAVSSLLLMPVFVFSPVIFGRLDDTIKAHPGLYFMESIYEIDYCHYPRNIDGMYFFYAVFALAPIIYLLYHLYRIRHLTGSANQRLKYIEYRKELHRKKSSELNGRYRELNERIKHLDNNYTDQEVTEWFELHRYRKDGNYGDKRDIGVPTSAETVNWNVNRQSNNSMYKFFGWLFIIVSIVFIIVIIIGCRSRKHESERLHEQYMEYKQNTWNRMHHDDPVEEEATSDAKTIDPLPETVKPATSVPTPKSSSSTPYRSYRHSSGSSYSYSSSSHTSSYDDDWDDEDDDDTWYHDEDDADEKYEYDYWE